MKTAIIILTTAIMHPPKSCDITSIDVARASFYRNYSSKEDVITTLIADALEEFRKDTQYDGNERYKLYIYICSLYNTAMVWLQSNQKESIDEIADMFYQTCVLNR